MLANLDLLLTVVYCIADDFLPKPAGNARRRITDAEIVTLAVAQAIMGIPFGSAVHRRRSRASAASVPGAARSGRLPQAPDQAVRADRGADRRVRASQPRLHGRFLTSAADAR
jgi:hypothetical protein